MDKGSVRAAPEAQLALASDRAGGHREGWAASCEVSLSRDKS